MKKPLKWRLFWKHVRRFERFIDRLRAPWPLDGECFSSHRPGHSCEQCHPTHRDWREVVGA